MGSKTISKKLSDPGRNKLKFVQYCHKQVISAVVVIFLKKSLRDQSSTPFKTIHYDVPESSLMG